MFIIKRMVGLFFLVSSLFCVTSGSEIIPNTGSTSELQSKLLVFQTLRTIKVSLAIGMGASFYAYVLDYGSIFHKSLKDAIVIGSAITAISLPFIALCEYASKKPTIDEVEKMNWPEILLAWPQYNEPDTSQSNLKS